MQEALHNSLHQRHVICTNTLSDLNKEITLLISWIREGHGISFFLTFRTMKYSSHHTNIVLTTILFFQSTLF